MASLLALPWLYGVVKAALAADGTPCTNEFGWRIPAQHAYGNRIAWIPGDPNGAMGTVGPPRNPGGDPRTLGTLNEMFTVIIYGQDPTDPENELKQYSIVRYLRDAWFRAVYHAMHGAYTIRYEKWITTRLERRHGAALEVVGDLQATIPDLPYSQIPPYADAPADTGVVVDITELDVTERIEIEKDDVTP